MSLITDKTLLDFMVNLCQHAALVCTKNTHKAYQYLQDAHVNTLNSGSIYEFTGGEYTWTCRVLDLIEPCIRVKLTRGSNLYSPVMLYYNLDCSKLNSHKQGSAS